jgi:SAM-dependent methyltransferase
MGAARSGGAILRKFLKRTEMRFRAHLPASLRAAYRIARGLRHASTAEPLPPALLSNCRFCASREAMLELLPKGGIIAELGTYRGGFARVIVKNSSPKALHLVDIDYSQFDAEGLAGQEVIRHVGLTHEVIAGFPEAHFDWVYIDADHSYEGCLRDARAAASRVRPGGYIVFNDFAHIDPWMGRYGVHRAATDFAREAGWPMAFFSYNPHGLYDAAFQRPSL